MSCNDQNPTKEPAVIIETASDPSEADLNHPPAMDSTYPWQFEQTFLGPILR